jgi:hypothetical protein
VSHFFDDPIGIVTLSEAAAAGEPKGEGSSGTDTLVCGPAISAAPPAKPLSGRQMKWDTVPLNFLHNSHKTNDGHTKQVGHFFENPTKVVVPSEQAEPKDEAGSDRSFAHFYSTMRKSRNPYISMKTNDRCHFYSTMKPWVPLR